MFLIFELVFGTLMMSVTAALLRALDCEYDVAAPAKPHLAMDQSMECWGPAHQPYALVSLLFLTVMLTVGPFFAMVVASEQQSKTDHVFGDGKEPPKIASNGYYVLVEKLAKLVVVMTSVNLSDRHPWVHLSVQLAAVLLVLRYAAALLAPCISHAHHDDIPLPPSLFLGAGSCCGTRRATTR